MEKSKLTKEQAAEEYALEISRTDFATLDSSYTQAHKLGFLAGVEWARAEQLITKNEDNVIKEEG